MPTFDSGRAASLGGINIRNKRGSDLNGIRFADNRSAAPTSTNDMVLYRVSNSLRFWDGTTEYNLLTSVSGSVGDLNGVYENGSAVTIDEGPIVLTDATAAALDMLRLTKSGAGSGDSLEFLHTAAATGRAIYMDMNLAIARTGILIDSGGTARTGADIQFTDDSTGAHSVIDINSSGSGASVGLDWTDSYNGSDASFGVKLTLDADDGIDSTALQIVRGAGIRTVPAIDINDGSTGSAHLIDIDLTGAFTGNVIDFATAAAATGNVIYINLDNAVAMTALHIEGSGVNEQPFVEIATDGTGAAPIVDIVLTGATHSGNVIAIGLDAATTGNVLDIDMNAGVGARALFLDAGGGARTANLVDVTYDSTGNLDLCEITETNTGSGHLFDINVNGAGSGNVIDVLFGAVADTGDAISINLGATAVGAQAIVIASGNMTRTTNLVDITESGTASGNMIQLTFGTAASTGEAIAISMGTNLAGSALTVNGTGVRTDDLIKIDDNSTGNSHIFDINLTGIYTGNVLDIAFATAAATGDAISLAMGTNVAGQAIVITSAATGVSGEGSALDITHTGILVAGANLVDIISTGSPSSTSNTVSIQQTTGAGAAGAYALYVNATGANVEALKVDAGAVVFDETLLVTGVATFTAKPVLPILTELNTTIDTHSTAAAINATATATAAEVATGRITSTSAAATTITLPTGTLLGGELSASAGDVFDLVIDNTAGASTVTIAVAVNGVLSTAAVDTAGSFGDLTVAAGVTGIAVYRIMFSSATAYVFTRVA